MVNVNRVIIAGNLACDPELKEISNGRAMTVFPVAVARRYKNKAGETQKETSFFRIIVWNSTARNCAKYLAKGRPVLVDGRLETRSFTSDSGQTRYVTQVIGDKVVFLSGSKALKSEQASEEPAIF
ncbi:MAG: single-strand DNA-binding protein [Clostridiales bacterium]|jgi:single-strand DNA-binding protein|nr:single-strand DNA-binding protein [Clostridiales bacterium]MDN5281084.1 single-strand DNA-binding protein [Candidatus Ozemobacter sp.]